MFFTVISKIWNPGHFSAKQELIAKDEIISLWPKKVLINFPVLTSNKLALLVPMTANSPSLLNATDYTGDPLPSLSSYISKLYFKSHNLAVPSIDPVITTPLATAMDVTRSLWPKYECRHVPFALHLCAFTLTVKIKWPFGSIATDLTGFSCWNTSSMRPVLVSHSLAVPSLDPVTKNS